MRSHFPCLSPRGSAGSLSQACSSGATPFTRGADAAPMGAAGAGKPTRGVALRGGLIDAVEGSLYAKLSRGYGGGRSATMENVGSRFLSLRQPHPARYSLPP